jgi:hypothetical protein
VAKEAILMYLMKMGGKPRGHCQNSKAPQKIITWKARLFSTANCFLIVEPEFSQMVALLSDRRLLFD